MKLIGIYLFGKAYSVSLARVRTKTSMGYPDRIVVGIDVGGKRKGFHAVALYDGEFVDKKADSNPKVIVDWCLDRKADVVAVDAPCQWSKSGRSRLAERELKLGGKTINCYATPTRHRALNRNFYQWVINGEKLYQCLEVHYPLFDGTRQNGRACFETFPHAIVCALAGRVVLAKPKGAVRRNALREKGYDDRDLPNIDFVDAALCAVAAEDFRRGNYQRFGNPAEGFIVVPD